MSIDAIGNFLTVIRNGTMSSKPYVVANYSKMHAQIGDILKREGFIKDSVVMDEEGKKFLKIVLKYVDGESVIHEIVRVSKPSRRQYSSSHALEPVIGGLGISILTTNRGILTNKQAKEQAIGGEIICTVW